MLLEPTRPILLLGNIKEVYNYWTAGEKEEKLKKGLQGVVIIIV